MPQAKTAAAKSIPAAISQKLAALVLDRVTAADVETLSILMDVDQVSHLLQSMQEARLGQHVSMSEAFSDL